jgi:hypothetical protein
MVEVTIESDWTAAGRETKAAVDGEDISHPQLASNRRTRTPGTLSFQPGAPVNPKYFRHVESGELGLFHAAFESDLPAAPAVLYRIVQLLAQASRDKDPYAVVTTKIG